jgi:hypothetical protein
MAATPKIAAVVTQARARRAVFVVMLFLEE